MLKFKENIILILSILYVFISEVLTLDILIIENDIFDEIHTESFIFFAVLFLILMLIFSKKKIFSSNKDEKIDAWAGYVIMLIACYWGNINFIPYINSLGKENKVSIEAPILRKGGGGKHKPSYVEIDIDGQPEEIRTRNYHLKVGDIYKVTIYEGWMGIRYYKLNDNWTFHKNEINDVHKKE